MSDKSEHACEICGAATDLRGWVFVQALGTTDLQKQYQWWCRFHFLQWMFNLRPYRCSANCETSPFDEDGLVWLQFEVVLTVMGKTPKCPWCKKPMALEKSPKKKPMTLARAPKKPLTGRTRSAETRDSAGRAPRRGRRAGG